MEIPKMKIVIYALTFLGYAWSGYGANIITNLRDAVLTAEKVFGEVLENVVTVVKRFRHVRDVLDAATEETCTFTCPSGAKPVENRRHTPTSNGCGSYGLELNDYLKSSQITECCNTHDICYDTCNSGKEKCDFDMQRCLYKLCESGNYSNVVVKTCKTTAKMMFASTFTLGCKAYQDSQSKACYCPEPKKSKRYPGGEL